MTWLTDYWQLLLALGGVWAGVMVLYIISRLKPGKRAAVKLKSNPWRMPND